MDYLSLVGYLWKAVVAVPALGVGIAIGAFAYRYLLKKNPTMLNNLVALAEAELQKVAATAAAKVSAAPSAAPAVDVAEVAETVLKDVTQAPNAAK